MIKRSLALVLILFFFNSIQAKNFVYGIFPPISDSLEIIISLDPKKPELYETIKNGLQNMSGVSYIAYCSNHSVYLMYIDKDVYSTDENFFRQLQKKLGENAIDISLKPGPIKELVGFCITDTDDASTIKNNFSK